MAITPEIYEKKRDELIELLENVLKLPKKWERMPLINDSAPKRQETVKDLEQIRSKLKANQFKIVLVAAFQGGKSTTFNIFCDGREISPVGCMLKTSACILQARNIDEREENQNERALIQWRTNEELCMGFVELLKTQFILLGSSRFSDNTFNQIAKNLDLDSKEDRKLLKKAVDGEWKIYHDGRRKYKSADIDILRIATIVSEFYNDEKLKVLKSEPEFDIKDIGSLLTFAEDWDARWEERGINGFKFEEVVFAFIGHVECFLHSKNLSRLGCVVVDCPGLFASPWDTEVARIAMFGADAIWFLIGGDRQIGQDGLEVAQWLSDNKMDHKLFYSINGKGISRELIESRIIPANVAALKKIGLNAEQSDLALYNAFLALRAVQGKELIDGNLPTHTEKKIIEHALKFGYPRVDNIRDAWIRPVRKSLETMRPGEFTTIETDEDGNELTKSKIQKIDDNTINVVLKESELEPTLVRIERHLVENRAETILVFGGSEKAKETLDKFEGILKNIINAADSSLDKLNDQKCKAQQKLKDFEEEYEKIVAPLKNEGLDNIITKDFIDRILKPALDSGCDCSAKRIWEEALTWENLRGAVSGWFGGNTDTGVKNIAKTIVEEEFTKKIKIGVEFWIQEHYQNRNDIFNATVIPLIVMIENQLKSKWEGVSADDLDTLSNVYPPRYKPNIIFDGDDVVEESLEGVDSAVRTANNLIVKTLMTIASAMIATLLAVIFTPATWPLLISAGSIALIVGVIMGAKTQEYAINKIADSLKKNVHNVIDAEVKIPQDIYKNEEVSIKKEINKFVSKFRKNYIKAFDDGISNMKKRFNSNYEEAKKIVEKEQCDRDAIAHESQIVLTDIRELNEEISNFGSEVSKLVKR